MKTAERSFYLLFIAALIFLLLLMRMCSGTAKQVISVKADTVYKHYHDTIKEYTPRWVTKTDHDTLYIDSLLIINPTDTAAILKDYLATYYYVDSIGTQCGTIRLEDSISHNRIKTRRWYTDLEVPVITEARTIMQKPRNQIYIGLHVAGSNNLFSGFGPGLLLKTKADKIYQLRATWLKEGNWLYQAEADFKLSFHR